LHPESVALESCQTKHGQAGLPKLGLTENSRTTDFGLGLFVLILIRIMSSIQLWTYVINYLSWQENSTSEC